MKKTTNLLCLTALLLALLAVITALITQTYWIWAPSVWGPGYWLWPGATQTLIIGSGILLLLAAIPRLAEINPKVVIATLCLLILSETIRFLDLAAWTPRTFHRTQGNYVLTHNYAEPHGRLWREKLDSFSGRPHIQALEVGSYEGSSAIWFLENILTDPSSSIVCIDIFDGPFEQVFDANLSGFKSQLKKIKAPSQEALRRLEPESFDFIYIDGSHTAKDVFLDTALSWDLLKPGGIMIFDDYEWKGLPGQNFGPGLVPKPALDAFLHVFEPYVEIVHKEYQLIIKKRKREDQNSPRLKMERKAT